jgi:acyl carrier protein
VNNEATVERDDVMSMIANLDGRPVAEIDGRIDSMQLAWLVHQAEQRYGVEIELTDGQYARMGTVDGAVEVLREAIAAVPR